MYVNTMVNIFKKLQWLIIFFIFYREWNLAPSFIWYEDFQQRKSKF